MVIKLYGLGLKPLKFQVWTPEMSVIDAFVGVPTDKINRFKPIQNYLLMDKQKENLKFVNGKLITVAEDKKSYEFYHLEAEHIFEMAQILEKNFDAVFDLPIYGFDAVFFDFKISDIKMLLGWDIWSGIFIMCKDKKDNYMVDKIKFYFENEYLTHIIDQ